MSDSADIPPVGQTAIGVAAIRAAESAGPDPLFSDPLAASFVRATGLAHQSEAEAAKRDLTSLRRWVAIRTRFLDEVVIDACGQGCRQFVILGAGLDARAYRLGWPPGVRLYELDLPAVLAFKAQVLASEFLEPRCERVTVPTDLNGDWGTALDEAGFDPGRPTGWLAEGLLAYLTSEAADALVTAAAQRSVNGNRFGLTLASVERLRSWREAHPDGSDPHDYVALWRSAAPENAVEWLGSKGWQATVFSVCERSAAYGRPFDDPDDSRPDARLVDAVRVGVPS